MIQRGFSLIELLVVIAIIGILSAVGVFAYNGYTAAANEKACKGNFRTLVKSVYENISWCELNPTINFLWNNEQSWEFDCDTMFVNGLGFGLSQWGYTPKEQLARLTIDDITTKDRFRKSDSKIGSRTTLNTMSNPYTRHSPFDAHSPSSRYYDDKYDQRGKVSLRKRDRFY